ncbi:T9SS type A sorting domain-containing protein, partial [candidate division KSB1 bacterium]|nr:T9SS type A sorting domain-containing protein [candidate division KSB1 bacterium]
PYLTAAGINSEKRVFFGTSDGRIIGGDMGTAVIDRPAARPVRFNLEQNYPNPFNASTLIRFEIYQNSPVKLQIFDTLGREIATLVDKPMNAGAHSVTYEANDLASGVYFYRLQAGAGVQLRKMILVK